MATDFQKSVWEALKLIPKGRVTTYGAIGRYLGTRAYRAVGSAVGKNPYAPEVPCHRVVPADGRLGNYSAEGGRDRKADLLRSEGVSVKEGKIVNFESLLFEFDKPTLRKKRNVISKSTIS
ncbi:methylated-DNA--protein-cysteine methyltransferase [Hydrogenimonas sp.]|nr:methylated-DNA--protein-cysteine methyltransferase [Hydrogenimonas sp.]